MHSRTSIIEALTGGVAKAFGVGVIDGGSLAAAAAEEAESCVANAVIAASLLPKTCPFAIAAAFDDVVTANMGVVVCIPDVPVPGVVLSIDMESILDGEEGASVRLSNNGRSISKGEVA